MTRNLGRRAAALIALSVVASTGCAAVKAANTIRHDVDNNKATIASFTNKLMSSEAIPFQATYVTTGSSPATIVYAVQPPNGLAFTDTPVHGKTATTIIVNSSGEYDCKVPTSGSGARPSCQMIGPVKSQTENKIFDFYTPSHWVTFLRDFSLAAGFAGDKVTSSTMTVNGFAMNCVDFVASGVSGKSTICTTSQGILGYVKVASDKTKFEIKAYTGSPSSSLFALPPRAKITTIPTPSTSP